MHLRLAAGEHELAAALLVGLRGQVEDAQPRVEQVGRLLVGERAQRLVAGALGVVEGAQGVARRGRLDEVVGELEQPGPAGAGARALERLTDGPVQPGATDRAEVAVERVADEAVGEAERPRLARRLGQQVQRERLVEALEHLGPRDAGGALERRDPEAAARDGGDLEGLARLGAQRLQAAADRVAHAVGQRQTGAGRAAAVGDEQPHDLVAEERVALRDGREAADEVVRRVRAAAVGDEPAQVGVVETGEHDAPPEAAQLAEHALDLETALRPRLVVGRDDEHGQVADRPREEREQQQRGQIGGVEVVEEHDDGRVGGDPAQVHRDGVEEREAGLVGLGGGLARLGEAETVADLGRDLGHPARARRRGRRRAARRSARRRARARPAARASRRARRRRPSRAPARRAAPGGSAPGRRASARAGSCRSRARP